MDPQDLLDLATQRRKFAESLLKQSRECEDIAAFIEEFNAAELDRYVTKVAMFMVGAEKEFEKHEKMIRDLMKSSPPASC